MQLRIALVLLQLGWVLDHILQRLDKLQLHWEKVRRVESAPACAAVCRTVTSMHTAHTHFWPRAGRHHARVRAQKLHGIEVLRPFELHMKRRDSARQVIGKGHVMLLAAVTHTSHLVLNLSTSSTRSHLLPPALPH